MVGDRLWVEAEKDDPPNRHQASHNSRDPTVMKDEPTTADAN